MYECVTPKLSWEQIYLPNETSILAIPSISFLWFLILYNAFSLLSNIEYFFCIRWVYAITVILILLFRYVIVFRTFRTLLLRAEDVCGPRCQEMTSLHISVVENVSRTKRVFYRVFLKRNLAWLENHPNFPCSFSSSSIAFRRQLGDSLSNYIYRKYHIKLNKDTYYIWQFDIVIV